MSRPILLLALLGSALLFAATSVDKKISQTSGQISGYDKKARSLHAKMAANAEAILNEEALILQQQKRLGELESELNLTEASYEGNKAELSELQTSQSTLSDEQNRIEQELVFAIARNVSLSMLLDDERVINADALITEEVIKELTKQTKSEIVEYNTRFSQNKERIAHLMQRAKSLQAAISDIDDKRKEQLAVKEANEKALNKLKADRSSYDRSIKNLLSRKDALKKTLAQLNIIKEDEVKKAREEAEARARKQRQSAAVASADLPDIKQVGSSYQNIKTKHYGGQKTIAPLDSYSLVKKFGPYTDPIYNIKIFNESVSLQPKESNAKVKNVLNGKVILAQNTALLENVIIIEHANGIHTIYAHLDQIAPTVKQGKKLKKGSVIGRVNSELMFEVTQENYHINPMQLIR